MVTTILCVRRSRGQMVRTLTSLTPVFIPLHLIGINERPMSERANDGPLTLTRAYRAL